MKKDKLQESITWTCCRCGKKIFNEDDMVWYGRKVYHKKCAPTLLEKIKRKLFGVKKCGECERLEFFGRDDYPYCYEMFKLGRGVRKVPLDSISNLCPLKKLIKRKEKAVG